MATSSPLSKFNLFLLYCLSASPRMRFTTKRAEAYSSSSHERISKLPVPIRKGRSRYTKDGIRLDESERTGAKCDSFRLPPITYRNGPRPCYFTCRHTYENVLMKELIQSLSLSDTVISSPSPGFVCITDTCLVPQHYEPFYALQIIPDAVVVTGDSIKMLAQRLLDALVGESNEEDSSGSISMRKALRSAPRGSLSIHSLVPGMSKGQRKPVMQKRATLVTNEVTNMLQKVFPAARKGISDGDAKTIYKIDLDEKWLLQVLLVAPDVAVASLSICQQKGKPGMLGSYWPNWLYPLGIAMVDIREEMPSSAYRKLMEAFESMSLHPSASSFVVDLGAAPGGWTALLRRYGCKVKAVDRSRLSPALMKDPLITMVEGDAFTFAPDLNSSGEDSWMVSDIVAYPERIVDLLDRWCKNRWAKFMVVTMKFQGEDPAFDKIRLVLDTANNHGYECRAKHFFNNKNEVTLMLYEAERPQNNGCIRQENQSSLCVI